MLFFNDRTKLELIRCVYIVPENCDPFLLMCLHIRTTLKWSSIEDLFDKVNHRRKQIFSNKLSTESFPGLFPVLVLVVVVPVFVVEV